MNLLKSAALGLTLIVGMAAQAQQLDKNTPEERAARMSEKMVKTLSLDKDKAAEVSRINNEFTHKLAITKKDELMKKEAKKLQVEVAKQEREAEFKKLLSAEEFAKYESMKAEKAEAKLQRQETKTQKSPAEKAKAQTAKMAQDLSLTEDQKERIQIINEGIIQKNQAIKSNDSFTDEQKKEYLKQNRKAKMSMYAQVLTPEQMEQLKAKKKASPTK